MNIKHNDIVIDPEQPFKNDALKRENYAKILSRIISTYADGFVLAINNEWGTGKTTFVKMWQQQMINDGFQTLYFNAWENDFEPNPLIALVAELKNLIKPQTKEEFKSLLQKGAVITKNVLPHLVKALAARYVDTEVLLNAIEDTTKGATEILNDEIKEYAAKKNGLKEFRASLSKFVEATKGDKPIVFIIDELDRCRPNYAVELLEQVKHFFSVPGIVFVLSIDKVQLGHAVRGVYGNDRIDADEYLRRFIDIEYSIPNPDTKLFCKYLYNYFDFQLFFFSENRNRHLQFRSDAETIITVSSSLFEKASLSLRQQEKIFAHVRLGLNFSTSNQYIFPSLYLVLIFIKTFYSDFYINMKLKKLSLEELIKGFYEVIPKGIHVDYSRYFIEVEASLTCMYYNYTINRASKSLITKNEVTGEEDSIVKSLIDKSENNGDFVQFIKMFIGSRDYSDVQIDYLFKKIDLISEVII
ncbi:MAG TPA: P-loop NTPase fold protein [Hanamia sp.]